jgi:hypothetical protein
MVEARLLVVALGVDARVGLRLAVLGFEAVHASLEAFVAPAALQPCVRMKTII